MMELDKKDELLGQFFKENKKEIEDFGFSRRVIRKLPGRENKIANLWIAFCSLVGVGLFFLFDGIGAVMNLSGRLFDSFIHSNAMTTDPQLLIVAAVVILFLFLRRILSMA